MSKPHPNPDNIESLLARGSKSGVTRRAVIIGILLVVLLDFTTPYNDYFILGSYMASHHVPVAASILLMVLTLFVGGLIGRRIPAFRLTPSELVTIWAMMCVAAGIPSSGLLRFLIPILPAPRYFATPENHWEDLFIRYIPSWLIPQDPVAIKQFYDGAPPGRGIPWAAWAAPLIAWISFVLVVYFATLCLCSLIRRQWVEHERMTFPHVQLPLAMVAAPPKNRALNEFFASRAMWAGFAIPVVLYGIVGLRAYYPSIPAFRIIYPNFYSGAVSFIGKPWSAAGLFYPAFLPSVIGFGFLLTTDVSFSMWFFYFFFKLEAVILSAFGYQAQPAASGFGGQQFAVYQDMGGVLAVFLFIVYVARRHLKRILRTVVAGARDPREGDEALPYSVAVWGLLIAFVTLIWMGITAGMSWWVALEFFAVLLIIYFVIAWITSATGLIMIQIRFRPEDYLYAFAGSAAVGAKNTTLLAFPSYALAFYHRENMAPYFMNNLKAADGVGINKRALTKAMAGAILLGLGVSVYAWLWLLYSKGAVETQTMSTMAWPQIPLRSVASRIQHASPPDVQAYIFSIAGVLAVTALIALRSRFTWWPLHPVGFIVANGLGELTLSIMIAWACKALVLRYGGGKLYQKARLLFLGIILGEAAIGTLWIIIGFITGTGVRLLP